LEELTRESLDGLATQRLFEPLGMTATSYSWREDYQGILAQGYDADGVPKVREPTMAAHAAWSLYSTAEDYAVFVAFLLQQSALGDPTPRQMVASEVVITPKIAWGLGWGLQTTTPGPSFWHWGSNPGYRSFVVGYPEEQIAVVVCSNSEALFKQVDTIIQSAIGGELPAYDWF